MTFQMPIDAATRQDILSWNSRRAPHQSLETGFWQMLQATNTLLNAQQDGITTDLPRAGFKDLAQANRLKPESVAHEMARRLPVGQPVATLELDQATMGYVGRLQNAAQMAGATPAVLAPEQIVAKVAHYANNLDLLVNRDKQPMTTWNSSAASPFAGRQVLQANTALLKHGFRPVQHLTHV